MRHWPRITLLSCLSTVALMFLLVALGALVAIASDGLAACEDLGRASRPLAPTGVVGSSSSSTSAAEQFVDEFGEGSVNPDY